MNRRNIGQERDRSAGRTLRETRGLPPSGRRLSRLLLTTCAVIAACSPDRESDLVGTARLELSDGAGNTMRVDANGPPGKLRAQMNDRGEGTASDHGGCEFTVDVTDGPSKSRTLMIQITTSPKEVLGLAAGESQVLAASDHGSMITNSSTLVLDRGSDSYYSTEGTLSVGKLPSPPSIVPIDVDVRMREVKTGRDWFLRGRIDATYIGAIRHSSTRACPALADMPSGLLL